MNVSRHVACAIYPVARHLSPADEGEASAGRPFTVARTIRSRLARGEAGFTLIEIMVVVVIIGLLLTVVASNVTKQLGTAETVKSRADIQGLETALANYRLDNGFYPTTEQGLEALLRKPGGEPVPHAWNGPYLKGMTAVPRDRWGNEYLYLSPGVHNAESYDVWTRGQDGQDGGDGSSSDIGNWQAELGEGGPSAAP
jgi:general secretion pathway protein G